MWFRMHDSIANGGMIEIAPHEAREWNERGYGIFSTVQSFSGARRIANLKRIRAWAIDIDAGTKEEQEKRIECSPVLPSSVIETKGGFHVYWYAREATVENFRILQDRLVEFFGADKNARDLARVLRVPGYLHLKDPNDPFLVRHAYGPYRDRRYDEWQLLERFPASSAEREPKPEPRRECTKGEGFWSRVYNLDCLDGLQRLSGLACVNGERFSFTRMSNGNYNIVVDGKNTSCWVDAKRHIGSAQNGGPTLYSWLRWYGNAPAECVRVLTELYPELEGK